MDRIIVSISVLVLCYILASNITFMYVIRSANTKIPISDKLLLLQALWDIIVGLMVCYTNIEKKSEQYTCYCNMGSKKFTCAVITARGLFVSISLLIATIISLDRYLNVVEIELGSRKKRLHIGFFVILAVTNLISVGISIIVFYLSGGVRNSDMRNNIIWMATPRIAITALVILIFYLVVLNISLGLYTKRTAFSSSNLRYTKKLVKTLVIVNFCYLAFCLPTYLAKFVDHLVLNGNITMTEKQYGKFVMVHFIVITLHIANNGTNSLIYMTRCKRFYQVFKKNQNQGSRGVNENIEMNC